MKNLANVAIVLAAISLLVGIISRLSLKPIAGLEGRAFIGFTAICLLFAIALSVLKEK
jgi:hypothetical protein